MFVVIKNSNGEIINNITSNVVKTLNGEFTREDLNRELSIITFDKAIVDLSAIKNYDNDNYLYSFLGFFKNASDVIILVNKDFFSTGIEIIRKLIEKGFYNFAYSSMDIYKLIENKNSFDDVRKYLEGYDFLKVDGIVSNKEKSNKFETDKIIVGIENGTPHAGATTLMYMLVKEISKGKKVKGIEMFNNDSLYFKDDRIITCQSRVQFETIVKTLKNIDVFIVDLNRSDVKEICNKVIYLVDPGSTKLNKIVKGNQKEYEHLLNCNIVLNRSNIKNDSLKNFEYETHLKIVGNVPNLNERLDSNSELNDLVKFLVGNIKVKSSHGGLFSFLRRKK